MKKDQSTQKSFIDRVLEFLKLGDSAAVSRVHKKATRIINDGIEKKSRDQEAFREQLEDLQEAEQEFILNIDVSEVKSSDSASRYAKSYVEALISFEAKKSDIENTLDALDEEIKVLEAVKAKIS